MEILEKIKPSKKEEKVVLDSINEILKKIKLRDAKVILGGSGAKGTWLRDMVDIDIFVKFDYGKYKDKSFELSNILGKKLKKVFPRVTRLHGSRDYFQVKQEKFIFEIVPILDIKKVEQAKNITDISPLHAKWVNSKANKKLKDEIRLVKQFAKAQGCYGAESYIKGFSGYVLEILTIYYGSFKNLVKNVAKWKKKTLVDIAKYYKNKEEILDEMNRAKIYSPLVLIDPVQKDRNAAAAIDRKKYNLFVKACKAYLKSPSDKFFEKKEFKIEDLKRKKGKLILLKVIPLRGKKDVVGAKLLKTLEYIKKQLSSEGFTIFDYGWEWNKEVLFWFTVKEEKLPEYKIRQGPPIKAKENLKAFKAKHKKIYKKGNRVYAKVERRFTKIEDFIKDLIKNKEIKVRVKKINLISLRT